LLDPGWYVCRNRRRAKIFISNFPKLLGYGELHGGVWDNTNKIFIKFGVWDSRGFSADYGVYFDIIGRSKIPSNYPDKRSEEKEIEKANQRTNDIFRGLSLDVNIRNRSGREGCDQHP